MEETIDLHTYMYVAVYVPVLNTDQPTHNLPSETSQPEAAHTSAWSSCACYPPIPGKAGGSKGDTRETTERTKFTS